jgi:hypothetical protein
MAGIVFALSYQKLKNSQFSYRNAQIHFHVKNYSINNPLPFLPSKREGILVFTFYQNPINQ